MDGVPQRLTFVTLGVRDMPRLRRFYRDLGWEEAAGGTDDFASFACGGVRLALSPIDLLGEEAAAGAPAPAPGAWNGVTLAVNVSSRAEVDPVFAAACAAGAEPVASPVDREWGGYSGYVADPEGNRWELAWAPGLNTRSAGEVLRAMVTAFDTGDFAAVAEVVHPDYIDHQGLEGQRPVTGVDGFVHVVRTARAAYAELSVMIDDLVEGPDRAVARIEWSGTRPSGEVVSRQTIDIVRVADGRAVEHWGAQA